MSWLTPLVGVYLAMAVIPPLILLYFLKLRRRPQPIACTLLWKRAVEDLRANAPFQRLRSSLLLLLQLLALLLLVLSVMQPQIRAGQNEGGRTVLLIDNSASMTATDTEDGKTRLETAKERAKDRIETLYGGGLLGSNAGETMIVAFSDGAHIASRFSKSKQELLSAVDRVRPTHGLTHLEEALKLARAYTTNVDPDSDRRVGDPPTLEVFTDGRIGDLDEQVLRGERMIYHRIGEADADNVAIGAIDVTRPYDRPTAVEVFAALLNYNPSEITCDVQLSVDRSALAVQEVVLPAAIVDPSTGELRPGRKSAVLGPFEQLRGAVIEIAILRPDDLVADNVAQVVVPPPKQLKVGLVPANSFFVKQMLEGIALESLELLTPGQYERLAESGRLDRFDVLVFDDYAPPAELMPPGRYLTFGSTPPIEGLNEFGTHSDQIVLNLRDEHPVLRFVNLDNLRIAECRLVQPADDVDVIVEGSQGPVVLAVSRGPMQVIHVTFDPGRSTWPLLRSWVTFLFNAIDYLGHVGEGLTTKGRSVGEALTTRLPATAENVELKLPDGSAEPLSPQDPAMFSWGPIRLAGVYLLEWETPGAAESESRAFAVNLLSEAEANIGVVDNLEVGQETVSGATGEATAYTPLWPYAIGFCLAVLMFEWWVYHRKMYL